MPLYEYECDDCGHRFEMIRKFSDEPLSVCPACAGRVRKLVSSPAIQFKGTGWYITDYARKPSGAPASEPGKSADGRKTDGKDTSAPAAGSKPADDSKPAEAAASKSAQPSRRAQRASA